MGLPNVINNSNIKQVTYIHNKNLKFHKALYAFMVGHTVVQQHQHEYQTFYFIFKVVVSSL